MALEAGTVVLAVAIAVAAGVVGCFAVMKRMVLAADAISHVALPGIGVALALHLNPIFGATAMLFFGALLIWALEQRTRIATETIIGVVFSTALAVGSLMSSGEELIDALFGGSGPVPGWEMAFVLSAVAVVVLVVLRNRSRLVLHLVSPEIARTSGIDVARLELVFLESFALTVALGLRYLGVLLMGSLIIIPAATAKRVSKGLPAMLAISVATAVLSTVIGSLAAGLLHRPMGPLIITTAAGFFLLSLLKR